MDQVVLVGGSGFIGTALTDVLSRQSVSIAVVDREPPRSKVRDLVDHWIKGDAATDDIVLPDGKVVLLNGGSGVRQLHQWTHVADCCFATARLAPQLAERDVVLLSSVEAYGRSASPALESTPPNLPIAQGDLGQLRDAILRGDGMGDSLASSVRLWRTFRAADPEERWIYALSKRLQEMLLEDAAAPDRLRILRLANVFGHGQFRVISQLAGRALSNQSLEVTDTRRSFVHVDHVVGTIALALSGGLPAGLFNVAAGSLTLQSLANLIRDEFGVDVPVRLRPPPADDCSGMVEASKLHAFLPAQSDLLAQIRRFARETASNLPPPLEPPVQVVVPPRPFDPVVVGERQQACLRSGALKHGNAWTRRLTDLLSAQLDLPPGKKLLLTNSGTSALRLAIMALTGPASAGDVAILPSFTFPATAEVLLQLGYRLRFCDVDPLTWTLDPAALEAALGQGGCRLVVAVDALGNPCDYDALRSVCARFGAPLLADSAPSLGASYMEAPIGAQADAHAFSMSFAKVVSAGGAGGAVIIPADAEPLLSKGANWWRSSQMPEIAAIVALDQVERLDVLVERRSRVARVYAGMAAQLPGVMPQQTTRGGTHGWVHWVARFTKQDRSALERQLASFGIGSKPYYSPVLHEMDWAGRAETETALPRTGSLAREALALPMSSEIDVQTAERIAFTVARLVSR